MAVELSEVELSESAGLSSVVSLLVWSGPSAVVESVEVVSLSRWSSCAEALSTDSRVALGTLGSSGVLNHLTRSSVALLLAVVESGVGD